MRIRDKLVGFKATPREVWLLEQMRVGVGYKTTVSGVLQTLIDDEARRRGLVYRPPGLVAGTTFNFSESAEPAAAAASSTPRPPAAAAAEVDDTARQLVDTLARVGKAAAAAKKPKPVEVKKSLPRGARKSTGAPAGAAARQQPKQNSVPRSGRKQKGK